MSTTTNGRPWRALWQPLLGAALLGLAGVAQAAPTYRVTVLVEDDAKGLHAYREGPLNNAGQTLVSGNASPGSGKDRVDYRYEASGQRQRLGELHAFQINAWGDIAGSRYPAHRPAYGVVVRGDGTEARIHGFPEDSCGGCSLFARAFGLNDRGQATGMARGADGRLHAYIWREGDMKDLGTLGGPTSMAWGINNLGAVVGGADLASGEQHAFVYRDGQMRDLGTLGGRLSFAFAINDAGQIVGGSEVSPGSGYRAFIHDGGLMRAIATPGQGESTAMSINESGQVVGTYSRGQKTLPYVFDGETATDLNDALSPPDQAAWKIESVTGLNDEGVITGRGVRRSDGRSHVLLLTPVP